MNLIGGVQVRLVCDSLPGSQYIQRSSRMNQTIRSVMDSILALGCLTAIAGCAVDVAMETEEASTAATEEPVTMPSPIERVRFRTFDVNGLSMRVAEAGEGPLVLFAHGWPESWYSWRHQLPAIAEAGYHAAAPDMRGYGSTTAPAAIADYDITHLCGDLAGLVEALGHEQAVLVGHDWGAVAGWQCALLEPETFRAAVNMSVPYRGRAARSPLESWQEQFGDNFFYILYFQELNGDGSGIAEAEFDADPRGLLSRLYTSPGTPREEPRRAGRRPHPDVRLGLVAR